jgi:tetratricopeptide (TPR) repeat protein
MKTLRQHLTPSLLILLAASSFAQQSRPPELLQAQSLNEQGQSRAAIAILEPLVQEASHVLDQASRGIAWNLLGSSYRAFEDYDKARRCYETASHILSTIPNEQVEYASALDNLGAIEERTGQFNASKTLRTRARHIYQATGNHVGIAIASSNLAQLALYQNDLSSARKNIFEAFREAQLTNQISENNLAAMYTVKGAVSYIERDFHAAIAADQQAIDIWTRIHGPGFYLLGVAYSLRGQASSRLGDHRQAVSDLQHALTLLEEIPGRNSQAYLKAELTYAHVLRDAGSKQEAAQLEKEAKSALTNVRIQQCSGCTISAESFR